MNLLNDQSKKVLKNFLKHQCQENDLSLSSIKGNLLNLGPENNCHSLACSFTSKINETDAISF